MKQLREKLLKQADGRKISIITACIGGALMLVFVISIVLSLGKFDALRGTGSSIDVLYLEGPCCGYYDDYDNLEMGLYLGVNADGYYVAIGTKKESGINLYGVDFETETEFDKLDYVKMSGKPTKIDDDLAYYIAEFYGISTSEVYDYFGDYYLDTTQVNISSLAIISVILGIILLIVGLVSLNDSKKKVKGIEEKLEKLEDDPYFMQVAESFEGETISYQNLLISSDYLIDLSNNKGDFTIYNLKDYNNVYKCNIINGQYSFNTSIALENETGRILLASSSNEDAAFYQALDYLKEHVNVKEAE